MLISPAEPAPLKALGRVSSLPETLGSDFLMWSPVFGMVGVQRKTVTDLVASLADGRVQREIVDMKGLDVGIWLLEGTLDWTSDGRLLSTRTSYTRTQHYGVIFSMLSRGYWLLPTRDQTDTLSCLSALDTWIRKREHKSLLTRPGPPGSFGVVDKEDWQVHFLQGLPGVGYERARAILDHYSGLPFRLDRGLETVAGLGPKTARRIEEMFERRMGEDEKDTTDADEWRQKAS